MISVLYVDRPPGRDGIADFSHSLAEALCALPGVEAQLVLWDRARGWPAALAGSSAVVLQYNPFSYGRGGVAPSLVVQARRRLRSTELCVLVHEPYIPIADVRSAAMGIWQRGQLRALLSMADAVGLSTEGFRAYLPPRHRERARHMPVGSPLPDARGMRAEARASLGVTESDLVVALYGSTSPGRPVDHAVAAIDAIAASGSPPVVLNLGFAAPHLAPSPGVGRVVRPGPLSPGPLAAHLAAADIALLPFVDGASTRRTTLVAALQQEICVLSTSGQLTDADLLAAPSPILTPAADRTAFVTAATVLAGDAARRDRAAAAGRALFESLFDWPVVAGRVVAALSPAGPRARS